MFWRMDAARGGEGRSSESGLDPSAGGRATRCGAAGKDLDNDHAAAAAWARRAMIGGGLRIGCAVRGRRINLRHWSSHQLPGARDVGLAAGARQQPVVADAMKPLWQNVEQEAPDELVGAERYCAVPRRSVAAVILVAEGHATLIEGNEPTVCDGDAMGIAGEIGKHGFRPGEGRLGVDEPILSLERREIRGEGLAATQVLDLSKEREPARGVSLDEPGQEKPPEQAGQYPHWQQEAGSAAHPAPAAGFYRGRLERYPAARHNHMDVRMVGHGRAPGVEYRGSADARAEMLGIGGDGEQRLGGGAEQQIVNHCLVLVGDRGDLGRQREDHVEIADRQQIGLARCQPIRRRRALTLWAMAVAARVVSDPAVAAILAALDMAPTGQARGLKAHERGRAALLDCRHHLQLTQAHVPGIGAAPIGSMAMKDVCDLQPRAAHGRPARPRVAASSRSMMRAGRVGWLRPGSSYWRRECKALWCRAWRDREVFE